MKRLLSNTKEQRNTTALDELEAVVSQYRLSECSAIKLAGAGDFDKSVAKELGRQYYPVCLQFPIWLAKCISNMHDENARLLLVENLYEEHGRLDPANTHTQLFRRYLSAVGIDPISVDTPLKGSAAERLIQHYQLSCSSSSTHMAIASLYAFEKNFSGGMQNIAKGFRINKLVPEDSLIFFDTHAVDDVKHALQLEEVLLSVAPVDDSSLQEVCRVAKQSAKLLVELFESIFADIVLKVEC